MEDPSDNVVPVVRSPDGELYVVDKHHFLSVCYHVGIWQRRGKRKQLPKRRARRPLAGKRDNATFSPRAMDSAVPSPPLLMIEFHPGLRVNLDDLCSKS